MSESMAVFPYEMFEVSDHVIDETRIQAIRTLLKSFPPMTRLLIYQALVMDKVIKE